MFRAPTTNATTISNSQATLIPVNHARWQRAAKAAFDYLFVVPTLFFLLPLFLIVALLIKIESPGPVLHKRRVIGFNGRFFEAYNFRTTYLDANARLIRNREKWIALLDNQAGSDDPRVTRVGFYLRRLGLEDLPRLFNILNREMSLVGPHLLNQGDISRLGTQKVQLLTSVKPGLTGVWQVSTYRTSVGERQHDELDYVYSWSIRHDLQILWETLLAVAAGNMQ